MAKLVPGSASYKSLCKQAYPPVKLIKSTPKQPVRPKRRRKR